MALTGFIVNMGAGNASICADTPAHAIDALGAHFPVVTGSPPSMCVLYSASYTAPNIFPVNVICHDLTSATQSQFSHNVYLPSCDPDIAIGYGTGMPTLQSVFQMPVANDVAAIWGFAFLIPLCIYMAAWGFGSLIGMFHTRQDQVD